VCADRVDSGTFPGVEHLTSLTNLTLHDCTLQPASLLAINPALQSLHLSQIILAPTVDGPGEACGATHLLQLLARLTSLKQLELEGVSQPQQPLPLPGCSALAASSRLQSVSLKDCSLFDRAWSQVFPAGRRLTNLQRFVVHITKDGGVL